MTEDAQFSLYSSRNFSLGDEPLATMLATSVDAFKAELSSLNPDATTSTLSTPCFAYQTSMGQAEAFRLHIPWCEELRPVLEAVAKELQLQRNSGSPALLLGDEKEANVSVCIRGGEIEYLIGDPLINIHGLSRLCHTTKPDMRFIHPVLRAASHFFWHLRRSPQKNMLRSKVSIEVHRLEEDEDGELDDELRAPLITRGDNVFRAGVADVVADDKTMYGLKIANTVSVPLHVWAFFFDCSDLSICEPSIPSVSKLGLI